LAPALDHALELFKQSQDNTNKVIILITDGQIRNSDHEEILSNIKYRPVIKNHIKLILIGLGVNNNNFLNKSNNIFINKSEDFDKKLSDIIKQETKSRR
jgi:hypothetical protein